MAINTSAEQWQKIKSLLTDGFNLIPVREKDEGEFVAKSPYRSWTKYKSLRITERDLWDQLEDTGTTSIAVVCGKISGNLVIIDIDVKHQPGCDVQIFKDLQSLYPEIWERLRIHKTPSGGYHLLYKLPADIACPASTNLAERYSTESELIISPKRKKRAFVEIKGEGGLSQMPPSAGYVVTQGVPVPVLTQNESVSIINLMKTYTSVIEIAPTYKPTRQDNDYYDENPFEHFNNSDEAAQVLLNNGWKLKSQNNLFIRYTQPGSKSGGVHATFNIKKRVYFIFGTQNDFDSGKGYLPATALSILLHKGDKRTTHQYLVSKGYGKIKPHKENQIAKKAAVSKKPLPTNISSGAAALHAAISQKIEQDHPYGIFWEELPNKPGMIFINRENLYNISNRLGFRLHNQNNIVQIVDSIIYDRDTRFFFDSLKAYIKEADPELFIKICNSYEAFIESHGKFSISRIKILNDADVIKDTRTDCYKFYQNGMLHITATGFILSQIPSGKLVWFKNIQTRNFLDYTGGLYVDFIDKAIGHSEYLLSCIGYLAHDFKNDNSGYIIVLSEQCINPKDGGGSGKNIFSGLFRNITTFFSKAGSQVKYDEKFMQAWNFQKVFSISDVLKNFSFEFIKEFTDGTATMKKLHVNEYSIAISDMPKFMVSTNFSVDIKDGPIKRRVRVIEFTDFFTKSGGVDIYYDGRHFTDDWTDEDWGGYDTTMALSIQQWLKSGRKLKMPVLTNSGWQKQFEQTFGKTINGIIRENIETWKELQFVSNDKFKDDCNHYYSENNVAQKYRPSSYSINDAIADWCEKFGITYDKDAIERQQGIQVRGKAFYKK